MKFSLPSFGSVPSLSKLETLASTVMHGGFLGIDIGSSSAKIVQLSKNGTMVTLDTYGEIDLGPYADRDVHKAVHLSAQQIATVVLDMIHGVNATARRGAISIPLSATLINVVELPKRDAEQMDKIIASEVKPLIPVPIDTVILNWFVLSDESPVEVSLAAMENKKPVIAPKEKVMLIATEKELVNAYTAVAEADGIAVDFLEVEFFSAARVCMADAKGPALLMDLGATSTKLYAMNGHGTVVATHAVPFGGETVTEEIMSACGWNFERAENAKRAHGLGKSTEFTAHEHTAVTGAIKTSFSKILDEASHFVKDAARTGGVDVQKILLLGGGACMPGVVDLVRDRFDRETLAAQPFDFSHVPVILEDVVREVGPKFAVAMGVALRGMGATSA